MDFKTKLVRDSRLNQITNELVYSVQSGAAQSTYQQYNATSASPTNVSFSIQPPSESTVLDRNIFVNALIQFTITIPAGGHDSVPIGTNMMQYGLRESFAAFPFNSLITTATATFNNCSVSLNQDDVFAAYLRMLDNDELQKYQAMTPVLPDNYKQYQSAVGAVNNPLASYTNGISQKCCLPRGCHPVAIQLLATGTGHGGAGDANPINLNNDNRFVFTITATFTEPLFVSPFLFAGCPQNDAGILGLNNLNIVLNLDAQMSRFWSSGLANSAGVGGAGGAAIQYNLAMVANPVVSLYVNYLTLQTTQLVETKNVLPYVDVPRYITGVANTPNIAAGAQASFSIQNIQLQQIPDRFVIFCRRPKSQLNCFNSSTFLPITNISINFNNMSGILASATQQDLWKLSVANGCKLNWYEWSGYANGYNANGFVNQISTVGSVLIINPARDLSLPAYLAPGSQGQFSFQFNITVQNNDEVQFQPECIVACMNSGLMDTQLGKSSIYTALLSMDKVLAANEESKSESFGKDEHEVRKLGDGLVNVHAHNKLGHVNRYKRVMNELLTQPMSDYGIAPRSGSGRSGGKLKYSNKLDRICV